jgi:hypothetical protein
MLRPPIAGPVFPEDGFPPAAPIFFLIAFSPVILAVAVVVNWRVRALEPVRGWATTGVRRYAVVAGSLVVAALMVAGAFDWWRARAFERDARADAARISFQAYAPLRTPDGYATTRVSASDRELFFAYDDGDRHLWLVERWSGENRVPPRGPNRILQTRGGTLLEAGYGGGATRAEAQALLDSLAPVDPETLDFER